MDPHNRTPKTVCGCPLFCILKASVFAAIIVFMLFTPLGDPKVACNALDTPRSNNNIQNVKCFFCDSYFFLVQASKKLKIALLYLACVIRNLLYEGKLQFYAILEKIDKKDLCSIVCCSSDEDHSCQDSRRRPRCKCCKRKCSRQPTVECRYTQI